MICMGSPDDTEFTSCLAGCTFTDFCGIPRAADDRTGQSCPTTNKNAGSNNILREHNTGIGLHSNTTKDVMHWSASNIQIQFPHEIGKPRGRNRHVGVQTQLSRTKGHMIANTTKLLK